MAAYELRRSGQRVRLARQPMDLLLVLLERRQELVSREEMARQLWSPDVFTDPDAGIHTAILKIRQVLGDSFESPQFIETAPGKGYRFIAAVEVVSRMPAQASYAVAARSEIPLVTIFRPRSRVLSGAGRNSAIYVVCLRSRGYCR